MADKEATLLLKIKEAGSAALDHVVITLGDIKEMANKVFEAFMKPIEAFKEAEKASNALTQSMINAGTYSAGLKDKYEDLSGSLSKLSTFEDDQIKTAIGVIQTQARGQVVTEDLVRATMDLAAAKGIDLKTAAELVGKTIGTETNALMRQGVQIDMTKTSSERLAIVTQQLTEKYGGQAEAMTNGLGIMDQLKNQFKEQDEVIGEQLAPTLIVLLKAFQELWFSTDGGVSKAQMLGDIFAWITKRAFEVKLGVEAVGTTIGVGLAAAIESVNAVLHGEFSKAKQIWSDAADEIANTLATKAEWTSQHILEIDQRTYAAKEQNRQADSEREAQSQANAEQIRMDKEAERLGHMMEQDDYILSLQGQSYEQQLQLQLSYLEKKIANEQNSATKIALIKQKGDAQLSLQAMQYRKSEQALDGMQMQQKADLFSAGAELMAAISDGSSKEIFLIQKAAALAQIWVMTQVASANALASIPPPANVGAAAMIETIGYVKMAAVAATAIKGASKFADGGIVKARPGGMLGVIGEAGRDEAVIPLEDGKVPGMGGGASYTFNVYGGILGSPSDAREFAVAVDKELLKLRKANESVAFDGGLT